MVLVETRRVSALHNNAFASFHDKLFTSSYYVLLAFSGARGFERKKQVFLQLCTVRCVPVRACAWSVACGSTWASPVSAILWLRSLPLCTSACFKQDERKLQDEK